MKTNDKQKSGLLTALENHAKKEFAKIDQDKKEKFAKVFNACKISASGISQILNRKKYGPDQTVLALCFDGLNFGIPGKPLFFETAEGQYRIGGKEDFFRILSGLAAIEGIKIEFGLSDNQKSTTAKNLSDMNLQELKSECYTFGDEILCNLDIYISNLSKFLAYMQSNEVDQEFYESYKKEFAREKKLLNEGIKNANFASVEYLDIIDDLKKLMRIRLTDLEKLENTAKSFVHKKHELAQKTNNLYSKMQESETMPAPMPEDDKQGNTVEDVEPVQEPEYTQAPEPMPQAAKKTVYAYVEDPFEQTYIEYLEQSEALARANQSAQWDLDPDNMTADYCEYWQNLPVTIEDARPQKRFSIFINAAKKVAAVFLLLAFVFLCASTSQKAEDRQKTVSTLVLSSMIPAGKKNLSQELIDILDTKCGNDGKLAQQCIEYISGEFSKMDFHDYKEGVILPLVEVRKPCHNNLSDVLSDAVYMESDNTNFCIIDTIKEVSDEDVLLHNENETDGTTEGGTHVFGEYPNACYLNHVSMLRGQNFCIFIDRQGYDYCRYVYLPQNWREMFADMVQDIEQSKIVEQAQQEIEEAAKKAAEKAEYETRCSRYAGRMVEIIQPENWNDTKGIRDAWNTTKKNIRTMLAIDFPGVKFSIRKGTYYNVFVSWTDGPTKDEVEEKSNLDLFCGCEYVCDYYSDYGGWESKKYTDFANKYTSSYCSIGDIEYEREQSEEVKKEINELAEIFDYENDRLVETSKNTSYLVPLGLVPHVYNSRPYKRDMPKVIFNKISYYKR